MISEKIIFLGLENKFKKIFNNNKATISKTFENFFFSLKNLNSFLKLLIHFYAVIVFFLNIFLIIFFLYKLRINYFPESFNILSKLPYLKNIHNFIIANLLLHSE